MDLSLFRSAVDKYVILRTGYTCARLKSSGNKPEHCDAFTMSVIGIIYASKHAFRSGMGREHRIYSLEDDSTIILTSAIVAG